MGQPQAKLKEFWTVEEYLEFEKASPIRYEYVDGLIFAMAGESKNHNRLAVDTGSKLNDRLFGFGDCEAFVEGIKVRVSPTRYYYPDVVVSCSEPIADEDAYIIEDPILIVEVLSKTTSRNDRVEKMNAYQNVPGLREYAIIAQDRTRIEIYRHEEAGDTWQCEAYTEPEQEVFFESVGAKMKLADIYRRVRFAAPAEQEELKEEQTTV